MTVNSLINLIRLANLNKINKIKKNLNKKELEIIKILILFNIIKYVIRNEKSHKNQNIKKYTIILNNNNSFLKNLKNFYKPSHPKFMTHNMLKKATFKKNWILILSTNKGIITNLDIKLNKKIGGLLLFGILN